jgi:hypothetical protein
MQSHITVFLESSALNIVRWECNGTWDWNEFYNAIGETRALACIVEASAPVRLIINLGDSGPFPPSALAYLRPALPLLCFCQNVIIVQPSGFARSLISILQGLNPDYQQKILLVDTLESALTYAQQH